MASKPKFRPKISDFEIKSKFSKLKNEMSLNANKEAFFYGSDDGFSVFLLSFVEDKTL